MSNQMWNYLCFIEFSWRSLCIQLIWLPIVSDDSQVSTCTRKLFATSNINSSYVHQNISKAFNKTSSSKFNKWVNSGVKFTLLCAKINWQNFLWLMAISFVIFAFDDFSHWTKWDQLRSQIENRFVDYLIVTIILKLHKAITQSNFDIN